MAGSMRLMWAAAVLLPATLGRADEGVVSGTLQRWRTVTVTVPGPAGKETDTAPNVFTDYRFTLTVTHASGTPTYRIPGYFAADGDAGNTSAAAGNKWRAHFCPDKVGEWRYAVSLVKGDGVALDPAAKGEAAAGDGTTGTFAVVEADPAAPGFRKHGRLEYVGKHYLRFAGSGEYFLKMGRTRPRRCSRTPTSTAPRAGANPGNQRLKTWKPHAGDWRPGDPVWKGDKGKGLIGAVNYLAGKGCNVVSFLTYNTGGDGDNVWPFVARADKLHYDCSKLDQWGVVFEHAQDRGVFLHFKMQEQENDDDKVVAKATAGTGDPKDAAGKVSAALDGGNLGRERKLYCRELIARFGHLPALNWNLGEENTQTTAQQRAMAGYLRDTDPFPHHIVVHTFPTRQDAIYTPLLGKDSPFTGASLQNSWNAAHQRTRQWVAASAAAGKPWVCCNDEQGPANLGVPPDAGYRGSDGVAVDKKNKGKGYTAADVRRYTLWGTLTAGGAGVEYYFGYQLPENDLQCEDFRSRDKSWDYGRIAVGLFRDQKLPVTEMTNADELVGNPTHENTRYCFAKPGEVYLVYLPAGGGCDLDLGTGSGAYRVEWFDPRAGGGAKAGSVREIRGPGKHALGAPPSEPTEDWAVVVRKAP